MEGASRRGRRWPDLENQAKKTPVTRLHSNEVPVSRWWKRFVQVRRRGGGRKEWLTRIRRGRRIFSLPHDPRRPTTGVKIEAQIFSSSWDKIYSDCFGMWRSFWPIVSTKNFELNNFSNKFLIEFLIISDPIERKLINLSRFLYIYLIKKESRFIGGNEKISLGS